MDIKGLVETAKGLPAADALFVVSVCALALVWKALAIIARVIDRNSGGK